jgi:hypothetical protein
MGQARVEAGAAQARPQKAANSIRTWHGWLGMLIAPSVVFFALTGALQMLNLHESHAGYHAPTLLEDAAAIHKDQALPDRPARDRSHAPAPHYDGPQAALKAYWIAVAAALVISTVMGVVLALRNRLQRRVNLVLLALGTLVPLILALA